MVIRLAETADVPPVIAILSRCMRDLRQRGCDQWDDTYPSVEVLHEDVRARTLFVALEEERIVAAVCLNEVQPDPYRSVAWHFADEHPLVVHRLCVDPDRQGRGLGRRMMEFAEQFARVRGFRSIRLEVYPTAVAAVALYSRLGYLRAGQVSFPRRRLAFECLELILSEQMGPNPSAEATALAATPQACLLRQGFGGQAERVAPAGGRGSP